jgi:hypothetical protein
MAGEIESLTGLINYMVLILNAGCVVFNRCNINGT